MEHPELIWMRAETRPSECRAPLVPEDAARLLATGARFVVERAPTRAFSDEDYAAVGCELAAPDSWQSAPAHAWIVGLKELPDLPVGLSHRHVFFAHAYKGQPGASALLDRFARGGGTLYDLEAMTDDAGRRIAAFGYWAGYVGAALGALGLEGTLGELAPTRRPVLDARLAAAAPALSGRRALVIGAKGRCGHGAVDALRQAGIEATRWDREETRALDRAALLDHDLLVNAVGMTGKVEPFLQPAHLLKPGQALQLVVDVTCDIGSDCNALPLHDQHTTWAQPQTRIAGNVGWIAIDNLPSLLPRDSSCDFSAALWRHFRDPGRGPAWRNAAEAFRSAMSLGLSEEMCHA